MAIKGRMTEMSNYHPLLNVEKIDTDIESYLIDIGDIFRAFRDHDSGCTSFGVAVEGGRWFVKHSDVPIAIQRLGQAIHLNSIVRHKALPRLRHSFETDDGFSVVYDWVDGECLRPARPPEVHPRDRFRALPSDEIIAALDVIYDAHLLIADHGFIAEDFYDGCIIYDFEKKEVHLCDFDNYHSGPFVNEVGRLFGSSRFMAPEEFQRGEPIDQTTNVFTLGRTAFVLLGDASDSKEAWKGTDAMWSVVKKATNEDRTLRHQSVRDFVEDWRSAIVRG